MDNIGPSTGFYTDWGDDNNLVFVVNAAKDYIKSNPNFKDKREDYVYVATNGETQSQQLVDAIVIITPSISELEGTTHKDSWPWHDQWITIEDTNPLAPLSSSLSIEFTEKTINYCQDTLGIIKPQYLVIFDTDISHQLLQKTDEIVHWSKNTPSLPKRIILSKMSGTPIDTIEENFGTTWENFGAARHSKYDFAYLTDTRPRIKEGVTKFEGVVADSEYTDKPKYLPATEDGRAGIREITTHNKMSYSGEQSVEIIEGEKLWKTELTDALNTAQAGITILSAVGDAWGIYNTDYDSDTKILQISLISTRCTLEVFDVYYETESLLLSGSTKTGFKISARGVGIFLAIKFAIGLIECYRYYQLSEVEVDEYRSRLYEYQAKVALTDATLDIIFTVSVGLALSAEFGMGAAAFGVAGLIVLGVELAVMGALYLYDKELFEMAPTTAHQIVYIYEWAVGEIPAAQDLKNREKSYEFAADRMTNRNQITGNIQCIIQVT